MSHLGQLHLPPKYVSTLYKSKSDHGMIYALYPLKNVEKMNVLSHIGQSYIGKGETMSQDAVERLLGRLITDEHFRQMAVDSLFMACQQTGFLLSSTEMKLLSDLDIDRFAESSRHIDHGLCRVGIKPSAS
jgi:hypothetical protein